MFNDFKKPFLILMVFLILFITMSSSFAFDMNNDTEITSNEDVSVESVSVKNEDVAYRDTNPTEDQGYLEIVNDEGDNINIEEGQSYELWGWIYDSYGYSYDYPLTINCSYVDVNGESQYILSEAEMYFSIDLRDLNLQASNSPYTLTLTAAEDEYYEWFLDSAPDGLAPYTLTVTVNSSSSVIPYMGDIYVSATGSDETGDGTEDNPFATVDYALSYNEDNGGRYTIYVEEGTYDVTGQYYGEDFSLVGLGNVVLNANNNNYHFILGGDNISFANLTFINGYSTSSSSSLSFTTSSGNRGKLLNISNCLFMNNYGNSVIRSYSETTITNTSFINNTITGSSSFSTGCVHIADNSLDIKNSIFVDNIATNSAGLTGVLSSVAASNINIDGNYWGTNVPNENITNANINNWVALVPELTNENVAVGDNVEISVTFKSTNNGVTFTELNDSLPNTLSFLVNAEIGSVNENILNIVNNQATLNYMATTQGRELINFTTGKTNLTNYSFYVDVNEVDKIYVSNDGDDSNSGTRNNPLETIEAALDKNSQEGGYKTIVLMPGTYYETNLVIDTPVIIIAEAENTVVLDADEQGRIFVVEADVSLYNLTFTNGLISSYSDDYYYGAGGAILLEEGDLFIYNSVFTNNVADYGGAIASHAMSAGSLYIYNSVFDNNQVDLYDEMDGGSAVYSDSLLIVDNSTFTNNFVDSYGGTVYVASSANITNSIFNDNEANEGGAIYVYAFNTAEVLIKQNQFINNTATNGGAIYTSTSRSTLIIDNVFLENDATNGGAIYTYGLTAENIIENNRFINNTANAGSAMSISSSSKATLRNNTIISTSTSAPINFAGSNLGNLVISFLDNQTVKVQNGTVILNATVSDDMGNLINGGQITFTLNNLEIGTATVVNGIASISYDVTRGDYVISGNYSASNNQYPATINNGLLRVDVQNYWFINETGFETLKEAIDAAGIGDVIKGLPGTYIIDSQLEIGHRYMPIEPWEIIKNITITSMDSNNPVVLSGDSQNRLFNIDRGSTLYLDNIVVANGYHDMYAGAIHVFFDANLFINNCTFVNNSAEEAGAIQSWGTVLYINNTKFINNKATFTYAGAIQASYGIFTLENSIFINNSAITYGGAIYADSPEDQTLTNVKFINNTATRGGALFVNFGDTLIDNCLFESNKALTLSDYPASGGAIYDHSAYIEIINSNFTNNYAAENGGALELGNTVTNHITVNETTTTIDWTVIENCIFDNNQANQLGGAIYAGDNYPYINITDSIISNNIAKNGSALINMYGGVINIINTIISNNEASNGSTIAQNGMYSYPDDRYSNITIIDSVIENNIANSDIYSETAYSVLDIQNSEITSEIIAIENDYGDIKISNSNIEAGQYSIVNNGNLYLNNNTMSVILNQRYITSPVYLVILRNETVYSVSGNNYILEAILEDDNGNIIIDNGNLIFNEDIEAVLDDYTFKADYTVNPGVNVISGTYNNLRLTDLSILNATIIGKTNTDMDLNIDVDGNNATIIVNLSDDIQGNITVVVNDREYILPLLDGSTTLQLNNLAPGTYNVSANYEGNDYYFNTSESTSFEIVSTITLTGNDLVMFYKDGSRYYVTLKDSNKGVANQIITFVINGVKYNRTTDENGTAYITINLNSGVYEIQAIYNNTTFISINNSIEVQATVSGNDIVKIFRNGTHYEATFINSDGSLLTNTNVTFNINGVMYTRSTDENGVARLNINLNPGKYIITAINPSTGEMASNDIEVLPSIIENKDLVKYFRNESQYSVKVLDNQGNPLANQVVTFNINGVFYNRTSNEDGVATLNINLNPGTYIITAEYNNYRVSNDIEVLPVLTGEDLVMSYLDGSTFNAKLVDGQGNPLADEIITFNVNGVFYNRITGEDGIARLNINLLAGEYIITSYYDQARISNTISIE